MFGTLTIKIHVIHANHGGRVVTLDRICCTKADAQEKFAEWKGRNLHFQTRHLQATWQSEVEHVD